MHFAAGLPEDAAAGVVSGMRGDAEILIYVDVRKSLEDGGADWWRSDNGVVLSAGDADGLVSSRYWTRVEGRVRDVGVLWEDGVEVAELPLSARERKAPRGKGPREQKGGEGSKGKGRGKAGGVKELDAPGGGEAVDRGVLDTQE